MKSWEELPAFVAAMVEYDPVLATVPVIPTTLAAGRKPERRMSRLGFQCYVHTSYKSLGV